jgi:hypothetical protein
MNEALILAWRAFESDFSRAARSSLSYFLNAKAYDFKDAILPKLASRTTTRAQGFLKKRLGVDRIRDRNTPIDQQAAAVSINKGDRKAQNFTAWAEWLKPGWRPRKYRYTKFARGGDYKNRVRPRYVDRSAHAAGQGGEGYHVVAGGRYEALRFLRDLKRGKVSIRNAFFMGPGQISSKGTEWREGLYTVDADGKLFIMDTEKSLIFSEGHRVSKYLLFNILN